MAWIKMRVELAEDPAVIGIAKQLGIDEDLVVGKLHKFWSWADTQSRDGRAKSVTPEWVDRKLGVTGFAQAMVVEGWLAFDDMGCSIPNFGRHNGESAKKRAENTKRQQDKRAVCHTTVTQVARQCDDKSVTREEKIREENTNHPDVHFDPLIAHVTRAVERVLGRGLSPASGDLAKVEGMVRGWMNKHGDTVMIGGRQEPTDLLVQRTANLLTPERVSARRTPAVLSYMDTVLESSVRDRVWPGERKEPPKPGEGRTLTAAEVEKALARADGVARTW